MGILFLCASNWVLYRPLGGGLYEVRTPLSKNRIARVFFYIDGKSRMVLCTG